MGSDEFVEVDKLYTDTDKREGGQLYSRMKDGTWRCWANAKVMPGRPKFHYHNADGRFWLTHTQSGVLIATSDRLKKLKLLVQEPEFMEEKLKPRELAKAVNRWQNQIGWS